MPTSAPSICSKCHYVIVFPETSCPRCKQKRDAEYNKTKRNTKVYDEVYNTTRWKELRELVLKRDKGLCLMCKSQNRIEKATVIDHIEELSDGGSPFDLSNLQSLCAYCHNVKTSKERERRKEIK